MAGISIDYAGAGVVTYNGRPLLEATSIRVNRASNSKIQKTLAKGVAGRSKGAPQVSITIDNAVPAAGFEVGFHTIVFSQDIFQIGVQQAGQEEIFECWIDTDDTENSVDAAVVEHVSLTGRFISAHPI